MTKLRYQLRPAKYVERLMIADALRKLGNSFHLSDYTYIGFGALEFVDFKVFHKALGLQQMISIEGDTYNADRYLFNAPYATIKMKFGMASEVLPSLDWTGLRIVWLDYEQHLDKEVIRDVETVVRSLVAGSVLLVTVCAQAARSGERIRTLTEKVGEELLPPELKEAQLSAAGLPLIQRGLLSGIAVKTAQARAGSIELKQLFDFVYADEAQMQTMGWIASAPNVQIAIDQCRFGDLPFVRDGSEETPYRIVVPVLTAKEVRHLTERLPLPTETELSENWLSKEEQSHFASFYRWYPEVLTLT